VFNIALFFLVFDMASHRINESIFDSLKTRNIEDVMNHQDDHFNDSFTSNSNLNKRGILKTKNYHREENGDIQEIQVIGYQSNLYRDDTAALKIESMSSLIPWNGDRNILIDRYDCRGYLFDLTEFTNNNSDIYSQLSNDEQDETRIEKLCDEERYLDLVNSEQQQQQHQQEEEAQNQAKRAEISFDYNQNNQKDFNEEKVEKANKIIKLKEFIPNEKLMIPNGMIVPKTKVHHEIIEKTARFVVQQGLQMEILIKAKQSNNSQFNFLNFEDELNPYYKQLQYLLKNNLYTEQNDSESENETEDDDDGYLHPLLSSSSIQNENNSKKIVKESEIESETKQEEEIATNIQINDNINDEIAETESEIIIEKPKDSIQNQIINKLCDYVLKYGIEFEEEIAKRNDKRFNFINKNDKFHNYYKFQIKKLKVFQK
jgi:hypothetical protein